MLQLKIKQNKTPSVVWGGEIAGNAFMILIHLQTQSSTIDMWKGSSEYTPALDDAIQWNTRRNLC